MQTRIAELSKENYGPDGFEGSADWEAVGIIEVNDNSLAESQLHEHFASIRVSDTRELFEAEDSSLIIEQGTQLVDGDIIEAGEWLELAGALGETAVPIGLAFVAASSAYSAVNPNSEFAKRANRHKVDWKRKLNSNRKVVSSKDADKLARAKAGFGILTGGAKLIAAQLSTSVTKEVIEVSAQFKEEWESLKQKDLGNDSSNNVAETSLNDMSASDVLLRAKSGKTFPKNFSFVLNNWALEEDWLNGCAKKLGNKRLYPTTESYRASIDFYRREDISGNPIAQLAIASAIGHFYEFRPDFEHTEIPPKFFTGSPPSEAIKLLWKSSMGGLWASCLTLANLHTNKNDRNVGDDIVARSICKFALLGNGNAVSCNVDRSKLELKVHQSSERLTDAQVEYSDYLAKRFVSEFKGRELSEVADNEK